MTTVLPATGYGVRRALCFAVAFNTLVVWWQPTVSLSLRDASTLNDVMEMLKEKLCVLLRCRASCALVTELLSLQVFEADGVTQRSGARRAAVHDQT